MDLDAEKAKSIRYSFSGHLSYRAGGPVVMPANSVVVRGEPAAPPFKHDRCPFCQGNVLFERGVRLVDARCLQAGHSIGHWWRGTTEWQYFDPIEMRRPRRVVEDDPDDPWVSIEKAVERDERAWLARKERAEKRRQADLARTDSKRRKRKRRTK